MTLVHARAPLPVLTKSRSRNRACLKPNVELYVYLTLLGENLLNFLFGTIQFIGSMRPKFDPADDLNLI